MQKLTRRNFLRDSMGTASLLTLTSLSLADSGSTVEESEPNVLPEEALDSERFRAAVVAGDREQMSWFLARDPALIYSRDVKGRSVFVLAHLAGQVEIAQLLREQGLELDLLEATLAGDWERVRELCNIAPGMVDLPQPIGGTVAHAAALSGAFRDFWILQQYGADVNANPLGPEQGWTPARAAFAGWNQEAILPMVANLLGNHGDPNAPQKDGDSILHAAAAHGDPYLVRLVLRKHGDPEARNRAGETPLDVARRSGHGTVVALLENHDQVQRDFVSSRLAYDASGAPFSLPESTGLPQTLINQAVGASHGNFQAVRELVERYPGLKFGISSADEMTVEACAHTGRKEIVQYFLDLGAPLSLLTATTLGLAQRARELLREDPRRVRERGPHDFPLAWYPSIGGGNVELMEILLEFGVDLESERLGETVLHVATRGRQRDLVAFLLEKGAEINARRCLDQRTPLDLALESESSEVAELLRSKGGRRSVG